MADIRAEYVTLWVQCAVYFALACMAYRYNVVRALCRVPAAVARRSGGFNLSATTESVPARADRAKCLF